MLESGSRFAEASSEVGRLIVQLTRELDDKTKTPERAPAPKAPARTAAMEIDEWESFWHQAIGRPAHHGLISESRALPAGGWRASRRPAL